MTHTPQQILDAMKLARQAGDQEALADLHGRLVEAYNAEHADPTEGMSGMQKFTAGMGQGAVNLGRQAANLIGMKGYGDEELAEAAQRDAPLLATGAGKAGAFTGEMLATAPVGGLVGKLGTTAARAANAGKWGSRALRAGTSGVSQGAVEGGLTAGPDHRLAGAGYGAAGAAIIPRVGTAALRAVARGVGATPAARKLMAEGVDLTPGQMNPASAVGQLEEMGTNVPFLGPLISRARQNSMTDWQGAVRRQAMPPGAPSGAAHDVESLYQSFGPAYDNAKGFPVKPAIVRTAGGDVPLASYPRTRGAFEQAANNPSVRAGGDARVQVHNWLQDALTSLPGKGKKGIIASEDLTQLRSRIRAEIRAASKGADDGSVRLLQQAEQSVTDALESQLPRDAASILRATDAKYAQYKIVEDAAGRAGDKPGGITPYNLTQAVKASTDRGAFARGGGGPLRKLASSGRQVFDNRTPVTGARAITAAPLGYLAYTHPAVGIPAAVAATLGVATKTGRKIVGGNTAAQRKALQMQRALRRKAGGTLSGAATAASAYGAQEFRE